MTIKNKFQQLSKLGKKALLFTIENFGIPDHIKKDLIGFLEKKPKSYKSVLRLLIDFQNNSNYSCPSLYFIAMECDISRGHVGRILREMERDGILRSYQRWNTSKLYRLSTSFYSIKVRNVLRKLFPSLTAAPLFLAMMYTMAYENTRADRLERAYQMESSIRTRNVNLKNNKFINKFNPTKKREENSWKGDSFYRKYDERGKHPPENPIKKIEMRKTLEKRVQRAIDRKEMDYLLAKYVLKLFDKDELGSKCECLLRLCICHSKKMILPKISGGFSGAHDCQVKKKNIVSEERVKMRETLQLRINKAVEDKKLGYLMGKNILSRFDKNTLGFTCDCLLHDCICHSRRMTLPKI